MNFKVSFRLFVIVCYLLCYDICFAQQSGISVSPPLDIPFTLAGNFGELRTSHFHTGLDMKTMGMIGCNVRACASGYVSRIKIESVGYGRSLYITHPGGWVSVYGHLEAFSDKITRYITEQQYKASSFKLDVNLSKDELSVVDGEIIALAGNAGGSAGPHLHFEIRDEPSEAPLNPYSHFASSLVDSVPPLIEKLWIYQSSDSASLARTQSFTVKRSRNKYTIDDSKLILNGQIGVGVETYDLANNSNSRIGINRYELWVDDVLVYQLVFDKLSFSEPRYVNSVIDYSYYAQNKRRIVRMFRLPNNPLSNRRVALNSGLISLSQGTKNCVIRLYDDRKNLSELKFVLTASPSSQSKLANKASKGKLMLCKQANSFKKDSLDVYFPEDVLYENFNFEYGKDQNLRYPYSAVFSVQKNNIPLHKYISVSIKPRNLPSALQSKALLAMLDDRGKVTWSGGSFLDGKVTASTRTLGRYVVTIDTVKPIIEPVFDGVDSKNFARWKSISFKITDSLSGIGHYRGLIDGKWALFEYDAKLDLLTYHFDDTRIKFGCKHVLRLEVTDEKGNSAIYSDEIFK